MHLASFTLHCIIQNNKKHVQDLWKDNSAGVLANALGRFFFLTKIFFSIEVKTLKSRHVLSMSYTFSVITKNTFVRQALNSACKCTYATSTLYISLFTWLLNTLTSSHTLFCWFFFFRLAINSSNSAKGKQRESLNRGLNHKNRESIGR